MTFQRERESRAAQTERVGQLMLAVLAQLHDAYDYSRVAGLNHWDFAVEIESLLTIGITTNDLRWMVSQGCVEHACEVTQPEDAARSFLPCRNLDFPPRSRFVLAEPPRSCRDCAGSNERRFCPAAASIDLPDATPDDSAGASPRPKWDSNLRVLRYGSLVIKLYRQPAANKERVLAAFEEEGWPSRIADPLPPHGDQVPARRLQDVIKGLNHNQQNPLIRFSGDGTGQGIIWQPLAENSAASHSTTPRLRAAWRLSKNNSSLLRKRRRSQGECAEFTE
jgi:hypothetical protein